MSSLCQRHIPITASIVVLMSIGSVPAAAQAPASLPDPLRIEDVLRIAREQRAEIQAARAGAVAAAQRPSIVSAPDDPMVSASVDHLPFTLEGANASFAVEQRFPFSTVLRRRRRAAEAERDRTRTEIGRTALDVELEAASTFFMLWERREIARIVAEQLALSREIVDAASARYAAGRGAQADVIRAEIETARLEMELRALGSEVAAAEAMLRASLGVPPEVTVPLLSSAAETGEPPSQASILDAARARRPELEGGAAEIRRAAAEITVMRSMYAPMGMVRTGPAYTMADRAGWMLMLGVSVPIWRSRLRAGVREAEAMEAMARQDLRAMERMIEGEAASARELVAAAQARFVAIRDDVLPRARQAIDPILAGYGSGQLPLVSVVEAVRAFWETQAALVGAEMELGLAWARLRRAVGAFEESP